MILELVLILSLAFVPFLLFRPRRDNYIRRVASIRNSLPRGHGEVQTHWTNAHLLSGQPEKG